VSSVIPKGGDQAAVLVTGGAGFIGRQLVSDLAANGQTVVSMYHHKLPEPLANVYPVCSDMGSSDLIAAPLRGVETVVHLAWQGNFVGPSEQVQWNLDSEKLGPNIASLKNLISAMERVGTKRIVFLSPIGASRKAVAPYLQEKYLAEFFILNSKIPEKIIIRSSLVCGGSNDRFLRSILRVMQFPAVYPVPMAKKTVRPVHVKDLVSLLSKVAVTDDFSGAAAILEMVGKEAYTVDELFKLVSARYVKGTKIPLRGPIGDSLLPLFERESKPQTHEPTIKLKHYLTLGNTTDIGIELDNPLSGFFPKDIHSFKDTLAENQSP